MDSDRHRRRGRLGTCGRLLVLVVLAGGAACAGPAPRLASPTTAPADARARAGSPSAPSPPSSPTVTDRSGSEPGGSATVAVDLRVESRVADHPTGDVRSQVTSILTDPRGWRRAGFRFGFDDSGAPYRVVLAEGGEVDELCRPYDTAGRYSCQNGSVVALNADRWRTATPSWTGTLDGYRTMLVNHEVGHLLHLHHPRPQCPGPGLPAPVMAQQSTELGACVANPWPLGWEIELAARRLEPLAPPAGHDVADHRPSPPAVNS